MSPKIRGRLIMALIIAIAFMSYITIASNTSGVTVRGIYEVEVSNLAYEDLLGSNAAGLNRDTHLLGRMRH